MKGCLNFFAVLMLGSIITFSVQTERFQDLLESEFTPEQTSIPKHLEPPAIPPLRFDRTEDDDRLLSSSTNSDPRYDLARAIVQACDYDLTRRFAIDLVKPEHARRSLNLGQVFDEFDYCRQNWQYINDPYGHPSFLAASQSYAAMKGAQEDWAVLLGALLTDIGACADIAVGENATGMYAFTEVCLGSLDRAETESYIQDRYQLDSTQAISLRTDVAGNTYLRLECATDYPGQRLSHGRLVLRVFPATQYIEF